jgi:histone deacetylase complex regulatory component SIN3
MTKYYEHFEKIKDYRFKCVIMILFSMVKNQNKDAAAYEDKLRQLLGMQAYVLFTFDKAISSILKPISGLKNDDLSVECWKLFKKYEDSPHQYQEQMYYNDFLRLLRGLNQANYGSK